MTLSNAELGVECWAARFDGSLEDAFSWEDDVAQQIVAELYPEIIRDATNRVMQLPPQNLTAWELALRAMRRMRSTSRVELEPAREDAQRALELDPHMPLGLAVLAEIHYEQLLWEASSPRAALEAFSLAVERYLGVDYQAPNARLLAGLLSALRGQRGLAIERLREAIELNPALARAHSVLGQLLATDGAVDEAMLHLQMAIALSRRDPLRNRVYAAMATGSFAAERYEDAIDWSNRSVELDSRFPMNHICKAAAFGLLGQKEHAASALDACRQMGLNLATSVRSPIFGCLSQDLRSRFLEGLARAGARTF